MSDTKRKPTIFQAMFPILVMLVILGIGIGFLSLPAEPLIVLAAVISGIQARILGYSYDEIMKEIATKIAKVWGALLILVIVGFMIGSWMLGGTIPMLIYFGLKLISPKYLALTAFLLTAIVSVLTGTSWGSAGTIGVAFMGVAIGMDVNLALVAGAVVSGAYFGDKLSPLSDTTNLSSAVCGVDLYEHVYNQLWTTGSSAVLASIFYFIMGQISAKNNIVVPETINILTGTLDNMFKWNVILLIPLAIVLIGSITKKPTIPVMLLASLVALINAAVFQGADLKNIVDVTLNGFNVGMVGMSEESVAPELIRLLHRGGMMSMMNTLLIAVCAISFAGTMTVTGSLGVVISKMLEKVNSTFKLVASTIVTCLIITGVTSNGQVSILMPGEAFREAYLKMGLHPKVLSRTLEDSVTCTECLIPWTAAGAYMASTLGVATLHYLPYAILNYSGMIFALVWAFTGIGITKLKK
ncbi:Na+/H+ antiporter NhaC [Lachnoanaerobaculum orale]|uniref:Na+/H+ antiporter NhaC n=1 Tax=Lachnoanaerobaculum orale TaxID=979627 RepID=A0A3P3Q5B4_9FIRM|nr:Na+/H+ antiporter NhaC [Lachnoanaerobaculum orale]RRJ16437.1 Na+/H+ antiporter NhaC [Lachnoanaerobaculum orale]